MELKERSRFDKNYKGNAYVTLMSSDDYLIPVLILYYSLKKVKAAFPLIVVSTIKVSQSSLNILEQNNIQYRIFEEITYSDETINYIKNERPNLNYVLNTASKLNIFKLKNYEKICYLDTDALILKNIDSVFTYPDGSMGLSWKQEGVIDRSYTDRIEGFSGIMIFSPRNHYEELYLSLLKNNLCFDGDLFGKLFFYTKSNPMYLIPREYFLNITYIPESGLNREFTLKDDCNLGLLDVRALHYIGSPKPWTILKENDNELSWAQLLYKRYFEQAKTQLYMPEDIY